MQFCTCFIQGVLIKIKKGNQEIMIISQKIKRLFHIKKNQAWCVMITRNLASGHSSLRQKKFDWRNPTDPIYFY